MSLIGSEVRFEDYPLLLKLVWVKEQPGVKAVEAAADSVRNMGTKLGETTTAADASMRGLGVSWAGPAADTAQRSSTQLTRGAEETQQLSDNGAQRILEYGRSFEDLRPRIQWEDTSHLNWLDVPSEGAKVAHDLMPWVADEDKVSALTRNMDRDEEANRALEAHRIRAQMADDAFAVAGVDPPPSGGDGGAVAPGSVGGETSSPLSSAVPHVASASVAPSGTTSAQPAPPAAVPPTGTAAGPGSTPFPATSVGGPAGVSQTAVGGGPGRGGTAAGAGGTAPGVGGTASGTGGTAAGVGGTAASGVSGTASGVSGTASGVGGTASGVSGTGPGGRSTGGTNGTGTAGTGTTRAAPIGATGSGTTGRVPDPGQERARMGERFGRDITAGSPGFRAGPGSGGPDPSGTGRSIGGLAPGMRGGAGTGWTAGGSPYGRGLPLGEAGSRSGGAWRSGAGENAPRPPGEAGPRAWSRTPGIPGEGVRPVVGEAGTAGRPGGGYGSGFAPMMGGVGGMRGDGDAHRNRYLLPSSEPFDVDLPHAPPVLGPDEEEDQV